jgi:DNA-binding response OmpR family regulator
MHMSKRILIVEDEMEIAKVLSIELEYEGYEFEGETNVIDVYIRHLRKKLENEFSSPLKAEQD